MVDFFLHKYGIQALAEKNAYDVLTNVRGLLKKGSKRLSYEERQKLETFASFCGGLKLKKLEEDRYTKHELGAYLLLCTFPVPRLSLLFSA